MLNNIDNIGNRVKCMMAKMFSDEVLSQYSLSGVKQKKNFSNLSTYYLLIGKSKCIINIIFNNIISHYIHRIYNSRDQKFKYQITESLYT